MKAYRSPTRLLHLVLQVAQTDENTNGEGARKSMLFDEQQKKHHRSNYTAVRKYSIRSLFTLFIKEPGNGASRVSSLVAESTSLRRRRNQHSRLTNQRLRYSYHLGAHKQIVAQKAHIAGL